MSEATALDRDLDRVSDEVLGAEESTLFNQAMRGMTTELMMPCVRVTYVDDPRAQPQTSINVDGTTTSATVAFHRNDCSAKQHTATSRVRHECCVRCCGTARSKTVRSFILHTHTPFMFQVVRDDEGNLCVDGTGNEARELIQDIANKIADLEVLENTPPQPGAVHLWICDLVCSS